jgi:hypothetical protein
MPWQVLAKSLATTSSDSQISVLKSARTCSNGRRPILLRSVFPNRCSLITPLPQSKHANLAVHCPSLPPYYIIIGVRDTELLVPKVKST